MNPQLRVPMPRPPSPQAASRAILEPPINWHGFCKAFDSGSVLTFLRVDFCRGGPPRMRSGLVEGKGLHSGVQV